MFKGILVLTSASLFSLSAHAGFFGGGDEFKCGRDDAVKAVQDYIKSEAGAKLQNYYITSPAAFHNKDIQEFQSKIDSLPMSISNVSTTSDTEGTLNCSATLSAQLPPETLAVIKSNPEYLSSIISDNGKLNNGKVVWSNYSYSLSLADNKKDISVSKINYIQNALYQIAVLAVNKDYIIDSNFNGKILNARNDYARSDTYLNDIWKGLPDSIKTSMKKSQQTWVAEKALKCGKLSDANMETTPGQTRINIYDCQTKMTNDRITFLGGDNN
ncbi:lysozyme inhibitor LprI family protein [Rahnella selenatireducens]|uniref:lysozyme inhibitor LprI family protein n=1 Tax=Rahnella selenatireducens TaxID=3389797 RepID=UPI0039695E06